MAQTNTAEVIESAMDKLARLESENEAMRKGLAASTGPAPDSISVGLSIDGKEAVMCVAEHRKFNSGSLGYYVNGKVTIAGKRYQMGMNLIEIGSKPGK